MSEHVSSRYAVPRHLLLLAGPVIATMVSRTVMSLVDFLMVARLGNEAQAAILPAGMVLFIVIVLGMGLTGVVSTFVSQSLGRGQTRDCSAYAWQGLHLSLWLGVAVLPAWFLTRPLFAWVGHEPAVQAMEVAYVQIGLLSIGPAIAVMSLSSFFNGIHQPAIGFWATLISNVFNFVANYALIFGHWGFPAMGMAGAAWATTIAQTLQMLILLGWMLRPAMHRRFATRATWRLDLPKVRKVVWYGLPAAGQGIIDLGAFTIFTLWFIGGFGTVQLAAHNLAFKFLEVSFMPTVGLGAALTAAVGKFIGEGRRDLARSVTRWAMAFAVGYMGFIALLYVTVGPGIAAWINDDAQVVHWATRLLVLCAVFQVFDALGITHMSALRGAGDNHWPAIMQAVIAVPVFLLGGYLATIWLPHWGSMGPWAAATAYIMMLGLLLWARWTWGPWERIELLDEPLKPDATAAEPEPEPATVAV